MVNARYTNLATIGKFANTSSREGLVNMRISQYVFALTEAKRFSPTISPIYKNKQNEIQRGVWQNVFLQPISLIEELTTAIPTKNIEEN